MTNQTENPVQTYKYSRCPSLSEC